METSVPGEYPQGENRSNRRKAAWSQEESEQKSQPTSWRHFRATLGTLRSDNSDVHENVAEKQTSHHFKLFRDYPNSPCYLKEEDKRGERNQVGTEMVE